MTAVPVFKGSLQKIRSAVASCLISVFFAIGNKQGCCCLDRVIIIETKLSETGLIGFLDLMVEKQHTDDPGLPVARRPVMHVGSQSDFD